MLFGPRWRLTLTLALASCVVAGCERTTAPSQAAAGVGAGVTNSTAPVSFAPIIKRVSPAVVSIDTLATPAAQGGWRRQIPPGVVPGFGSAPVRRGAGSGFIISADGVVVTNNHVIDGAQEIVVSLSDGRQFPARLIGRDPPTDIAVLKIQAEDLPFVSFARSALPQVGDWVVAVGNPFGLGGTATAGIVSAQGRDIGEAHVSYIQIDAPINSGNSGGPSFDLQGRVVGVNTAIFSPSGGSVGIGFAIPADLAEDVSRELIKNGRVVRGYLGVSVQDLTPAVAAQLNLRGKRGALIVDVSRGGPAQGRLQAGDVVASVDGEAIIGAGGLTRRIGQVRPGEEVDLDVWRDGASRSVSLRVARRPDEPAR